MKEHPQGRYIEINNPELFNEHQEVIVFTREEFSRTYRAIMERIDTITKIDLQMRSEDWKLIGYWPLVMKNVYRRIDRNMDSILKKNPYKATWTHTSTPQQQRKNQYVKKNPSI